MTSKIIDNSTVKKHLTNDLPQWELGSDKLSIQRTYATSGWKSSMMIANAVGFLAEATWHHPEMLVEYSAVKISLTTHSEGGITVKDLELAQKVEALVCCQMGDGELQSPPEKYALLKLD